jgi:hypothetical protein
MATVVVSTNIAGNVKPSFASSPIVGLTVRANGEERVSVLDMNGNMFDADIPVPTSAPTLSQNADSGHLDANKWYAYAYVYAATAHYPFVENDISVGGSVAPRGNPGPVATLQSNGSGCSIHLAGFVISSRSDVDFIWIFRTSGFATSQEALDNGNAGNLYYIGSVANSGTPTYNDLNPVDGTDQVEVDNFATPPQFQFVVYADPYWWGWGNYPLSAAVSWATTGVVTITDGTKWFNGRDGQYVRLSGFTTGGIGNNGLWIFKWLTATTIQLKLADGTTNATLASNGSGTIVVQGNPTTLYRSKPRNPFSWGSTEILADGDRVPTQYAFKVGGGLGTAIGVVPTVPYLLLCTEYPANVFTLDLRQAGTTSFEGSLRNISTFYSITSHHSQFVAKKVYTLATTEREEHQVLWGWDAKNYCILECDGTSIHPISQKVSKTLRRASQIRSKQILAHGAYDAKNGLNCLWIPTDETDLQINLLICQHAYTGQWFIRDEHDLLCTAQFQDGDTNLSKIYCGTEGGFVGEAFAEGFYYDWISSGRSFGTFTVFDATSITRDDGILFYLDRDGYVGNWVLLMDVNGENEQWARISAVTSSKLTFDYIIDHTGAHGATPGKVFSPALAAGGIFMVGVIECRVLKMFSFQAAAEDKKLSEVWLTLAGVDIAKTPNQPGSTILRFYRRRDDQPFAPRSTTGLLNVWLKQVHFDDSVLTQAWFTQEPATERMKQIGIEIIDRGFTQWRFYDWTLKISQ